MTLVLSWATPGPMNLFELTTLTQRFFFGAPLVSHTSNVLLHACSHASVHSCILVTALSVMITFVSCLRASICLCFAHAAKADWKMETRKLAWSTLGSDAQASFQNMQQKHFENLMKIVKILTLYNRLIQLKICILYLEHKVIFK